MEQSEFLVWVKANAAERERMKNLAAGYSDGELARPMDAGWTAAAILAHLAFWDARAITLIRKWQKDGVGESPIDTDVVNEATRALCLAIPPRAAAALALEKAAGLDGLIAALEHIVRTAICILHGDLPGRGVVSRRGADPALTELAASPAGS